MKKIIILCCIIFGVTSCLKEEMPIPYKNSHGMHTEAVSMGNDYRYQIFFNLSERKVVAKNRKEIWDLGFETGTDGWHVITNTSHYIFAYMTNKTLLSEVTNHNGMNSLNHHYDMPSGNLDSTAIGNWKDEKVRVLNLGTNAAGNPLGWYKLKVDSVSATKYYFRYAPINASTYTQVAIEKDNNYNFVYFSMINNQSVEVAPPTQAWDLVFTQYIKHLTEPLVMDYLVTGCLSNRFNTKVTQVTNKNFEDIDLSYATSLNYTSTRDAIGYDWKDIGLDEVMSGGTAEYTIYPNKSYIVRTQVGTYYKLRFIDFYSKTGEKGTPTFEYQILE